MKKKIKILLMITVLLAALCAFAFSTPAAEFTASGACGDGVTWTLDAQGALTVSGSGAMDEFGPAAAPPWKNHKADIQTVTVEAGVTGVGSYAFAGCPALQTVALADSVISIGSHAFENSGVASIDMSDNVQSIGSCAFMNCKNLAGISLPSNLKTIGQTVFAYCKSLKSIQIPNSVTSIGGSAFSESGLTSVTIPSSVKTLGNSAFLDCTSLKNVSIGDVTTLIDKLLSSN